MNKEPLHTPTPLKLMPKDVAVTFSGEELDELMNTIRGKCIRCYATGGIVGVLLAVVIRYLFDRL